MAIFEANVSPPAKIDEFHGSLPFGTDRMISTATVSPSARPRPSIEALTTPDRPYGSTAIRIISHRVAPSASAPSRWAIGVCAKISRLIAVTTGRIMIASTTDAVNTTPTLSPGGFSNTGSQPSAAARPSITGRRIGAKNRMPHRP